MSPLDPNHLVRGQFRGYRNESGVSPTSQVETFAAAAIRDQLLAMEGCAVPAPYGQMPAGHVHRSAGAISPSAARYYSHKSLPANYFRFRISPDIAIATGTQVLDECETMSGRSVELMVSQDLREGGMDAYERLLHDAMQGDATLFAREDSVEQAWRIVQPVIRVDDAGIRIRAEYLGAAERRSKLTAGLGPWHEPTITKR